MTEKPKVQKIHKIHEKACQTAMILLKKDVDTIIGLTRDNEGWIAEVEVVERKSIPDTQDLLGRYELKLDAEGELLGYRRVMLRRRSDREVIEAEV
jgi:hypothetical protein